MLDHFDLFGLTANFDDAAAPVQFLMCLRLVPFENLIVNVECASTEFVIFVQPRSENDNRAIEALDHEPTLLPFHRELRVVLEAKTQS